VILLVLPGNEEIPGNTRRCAGMRSGALPEFGKVFRVFLFFIVFLNALKQPQKKNIKSYSRGKIHLLKEPQ